MEEKHEYIHIDTPEDMYEDMVNFITPEAMEEAVLKESESTENEKAIQLQWLPKVFIKNFISTEKDKAEAINCINGNLLILRLQVLLYQSLIEGMLAQETDDFVTAAAKYSITVECINRLERSGFKSASYLSEEMQRRSEYAIYMSEIFAESAAENKDGIDMVEAFRQHVNTTKKQAIAELKKTTSIDIEKINTIEVKENKEDEKEKTEQAENIKLGLSYFKTFQGNNVILPSGAIKKTLTEMLQNQ